MGVIIIAWLASSCLPMFISVAVEIFLLSRKTWVLPLLILIVLFFSIVEKAMPDEILAILAVILVIIFIVLLPKVIKTF